MDDTNSTIAASDYDTAAESPRTSSSNGTPLVFQTPLGGWNDASEDGDSTPRRHHIPTVISDRLHALHTPDSTATTDEQSILVRYINSSEAGPALSFEAHDEMPMALNGKESPLQNGNIISQDTSSPTQAPSPNPRPLEDRGDEGGVPLPAVAAVPAETTVPEAAEQDRRKKRRRGRRGRNHSRLNTPPPGKERDPNHPRRKRKRKRPGKPREKLVQQQPAGTEHEPQLTFDKTELVHVRPFSKAVASSSGS